MTLLATAIVMKIKSVKNDEDSAVTLDISEGLVYRSSPLVKKLQ